MKIVGTLKIHVVYDAFGDTAPEQLEGILSDAGEYLRDNGLLTQEADVMIDDCNIGVTCNSEEI